MDRRWSGPHGGAAVARGITPRAMHDLKLSSIFSGGQTNGAATCLLFLVFAFLSTRFAGEFTLLGAAQLFVAAMAVTLPGVVWAFVLKYREIFGGAESTVAAEAQAAQPANDLRIYLFRHLLNPRCRCSAFNCWGLPRRRLTS